MTNEPSPRPWHTANFIRGIEDANNGKVAANICDADAALIVDAVNNADSWRDAYAKARTERNAFLLERDRLSDELTRKVQNYEDVIAHHQRTEAGLRDIVRRMMEKLVVLNVGYRLMLSEGPEDAEMADLCTRIEALVREARAAIWEGETPKGKGVGR